MKKNMIVILITVIIIAAMWNSAPKQASEPVLEVFTINPQKKNIYDYINASGRVKEAERKDIYIDNIGTVSKVFVNIGDEVRAGEPLVEIMPILTENELGYGNYINSSQIEEIFNEYVASFSFDTERICETTDSETEYIIKSPIDGVITALAVDNGDRVTPLSKIVTVSDFSNLYIKTMIPEEYSSKVTEGDEVEISSLAFGDMTLCGEIEQISPVARYIPSITGTGKTYVEATVTIDNLRDFIRPELSVNTKITANTIKGALTLPYECILQDENEKEYVFCVENGYATKTFITIGYELEEEVQILDGITKESVIVYDPGEDVADGRKIKITEHKNAIV